MFYKRHQMPSVHRLLPRSGHTHARGSRVRMTAESGRVAQTGHSTTVYLPPLPSARKKALITAKEFTTFNQEKPTQINQGALV